MTAHHHHHPVKESAAIPPIRKSGAGVKTVNLALQGGGAHGAFGWGVLDRLLEEDGLSFDGVSATSAGAMNAALLAYGLAAGGRDGAKSVLENFWRKIANTAMFSPLQPTLFDRMMHNHSLEMSPAFMMMDIMTRVFSPYETNPFNYNPLRKTLEQIVDFERLRAESPIRIFLSATNVRQGKVRVFKNDEITADAVLASACLPFMFQAVEIEGEPYWDGGYMGNPALFPLIYECKSNDIVVVHINPIMRSETPKTARDILNRINEISFNSSLMREMRAISFVTKLIDDETVPEGRMKRMFIHSIENEDFMRKLGVSSKLNPDWEFLTHLRDIGRESAQNWLDRNYDDIGRRSTVDIGEKYL
ncbi:MAG: alpha/beta hydrolase [Alphaproteobacteria bacterium RIFCSPHIGHO2_12_FULL_63_12]|nr:MAG: alpha/beta hydrolase [Alphaproteobacteria bacterium RIFCSPHIGHO2_12_FULL_63_12]